MTIAKPQCRHCRREFAPGETWMNANYCRAAYLLEVLTEHPGLSTWELAKEANMLYTDATKAMQKARDWETVEYTEEDRSGGGVRYRYTPAPQANAIVESWLRRNLL